VSKNKEFQEMRNLEEYVKSLRKDLDSRLTDIKAQVDVLQDKASKTVVRRPLLALGVAFVAGMAIGIALAKSRD
jgi:ElaB/YqjD/DUF883 family membrane-anchored ribosome-binding protein